MRRLQTIIELMKDFLKKEFKKKKKKEPTCNKRLFFLLFGQYLYYYLFLILQWYLFLFINAPRLIVYLYIDAIKKLNGRFHPIQ